MNKYIVNDGLFDAEELLFLNNIENKKTSIVEKNKSINEKRKVILDYIENNLGDRNNSKKYLYNTEFTLESIDEIVRNYYYLENKLYDIEKMLIILSEREKLNLANDADFSNNVYLIKQKIKNIKVYESKIEDEILKYEIIVDNYYKEIISNNDSILIEENKKIDESNNIINQNNISKISYENIVDEKIIEDNVTEGNEIEDNMVLRVSESDQMVYLPYSKMEIQNFLKAYPDDYSDAKSVVEKEFTVGLSLYSKKPSFARFREAYSLYRNREMRTMIESFKFAIGFMFRSEINPAILAAVKSEKQLEEYIECSEKGKLDEFKYFKIVYDVNPL